VSKRLKKKLIILIITILLFSTVFYFRNIIIAFISGSEKIDKHTFSVMLQGRFNPAKTLTIKINNKDYNITLPKNAGIIGNNKVLVPADTLKVYKTYLIKSGWKSVEQNGTSITVENEAREGFYISVKMYTSQYMILDFREFYIK